jgi:hypothetical protein
MNDSRRIRPSLERLALLISATSEAIKEKRQNVSVRHKIDELLAFCL